LDILKDTEKKIANKTEVLNAARNATESETWTRLSMYPETRIYILEGSSSNFPH
jgi:hypothetical protein